MDNSRIALLIYLAFDSPLFVCGRCLNCYPRKSVPALFTSFKRKPGDCFLAVAGLFVRFPGPKRLCASVSDNSIRSSYCILGNGSANFPF